MARSDLVGWPVRVPLRAGRDWRARPNYSLLAVQWRLSGLTHDPYALVQVPTRQDSATERRRPITVVVVDDEQLIRSALAQSLTDGGLDLVGEATNARDALELVVDLRPDVVLMDLRLPDSSGVQAIEQLGLLAPASRVLILTRTEENRVVEAIVAGASGYILKTAPPKAIIAAVRATAAGESVHLPPDRRQTPTAHPRTRHPRHHHQRGRRERDPRRTHRTRTRDLRTARQRQEQSRHRPRALAQHQHGLQPHRQHPRQTPPRQPHPSSRPSRTQRHLLTRGDRAEPRVLSATAIARLRNGK